MATGGGVKEVGIRLKVGAAGLENATALGKSLRDLGVDTTALDAKAADLGAELQKLGTEQRLIDTFGRTKTATVGTATALEAAQAAAQALGRELAQAEAPTKAQTAAMDRARTAVTAAKDAYTAQRLELQQQRSALQQAGISSDGLASAQVRVKLQTDAARAATLALTNQYRAAEGVARLNAEVQGKVAAAHTQAGVAANKAAAQQRAASDDVGGGLDGIHSRLKSLGALAAGGAMGVGTVQFLRSAAETADAFNNLRARMSLVTGEGPALGQALKAVEEIALRTGASLDSTGTLFTRVLTAGKELGIGQAEALKLTESINQAIAVSGASGAASDAAITQLIQGLQSGVLRGEEFNSVMEQAPRLAQALADGLGVTRGQLRGMAQDGQLSAQTVIQALKSQSQALEAEFGKLPSTVGRAVTNLNTAWTVFIGNLDKSSGATAAVADGINGIAKRLDEIAAMATRAGAVLLAALAIQGVGALKALAAQALATGVSFAALTRSIDQVPKVVNIAVAVTGFEAGYAIGTWLRENTESARKYGVVVGATIQHVVSAVQFGVEAVKAMFSSDTVLAAMDRWEKRAEQLSASFSDLWKDAEDSPELVRAAADAAAAELKRLGDDAGTAGGQVAKAGTAGAAGIAGIGKEAQGAEGAIASLVAAAQARLPAVGATAQAQAQQIATLALKSQDVARAIAVEIPEAIAKLSGADLTTFRNAMQGALQDSEKGAVLLQAALVETGKRAAQALGVDVATASRTLSKEFVAAQDNLALLIQSLPALAAAGVDAGALVGKALTKMIEGAKNQTELDALKLRVEALGKAGKLSAEQQKTADDALENAKALLATTLDNQDAATKRVNDALRAQTALTKAQLELEITRLSIKRDELLQQGNVSAANKLDLDIRNLQLKITENGTAAKRAEAVALRESILRQAEDLQSRNLLTPAIRQELNTRLLQADAVIAETDAARLNEQQARKNQTALGDGAQARKGHTDATRQGSDATSTNSGMLKDNNRELGNSVTQLDALTVARNNYNKALSQARADEGITAGDLKNIYPGQTNGGLTGIGNPSANTPDTLPKIDSFGDLIRNTPSRGITRTGAGQLQPPDNSGDWTFNTDRKGEGPWGLGVWELTPEAAARRSAEQIAWMADATANDPGGFNGSAGYSPFGRSARGTGSNTDPVTGRPYGGSGTDPVTGRAYPGAAAGGATTSTGSGGSYTVNVTIGGKNYGIAAGSQQAADDMVRALEEAYRQGGGGG